MARGWESKAVEAQQSDAAEKSDVPRTKLTPEQAVRVREKEALRLARHRILQQIDATQDPRYRHVLELGLAELDHRLQKLD
jgi:hypothetical protein